MVGGLVMGALEKLYRQPSFFTYSLLASVPSLYLSSSKKGKKKAQSRSRYREYDSTAPSVHGSPGHS
jgi:hypothetical protein